MAVLSASDVWAVGYRGSYYDDGGQNTRVQHFNGERWRRVPAPHPGASQLESVHAIAEDDVWAVGWFSRNGRKPLAMHWDGSSWTRSRLPNAPNLTLSSVSASASDEVWAVGYSGYGTIGLVLRFDGKRWRKVDGPPLKVGHQ